MGLGQEIGGDLMRMILVLVILFGSLFAFRIYASLGLWPFILIIVIVSGGFLLYKAAQGGYINI